MKKEVDFEVFLKNYTMVLIFIAFLLFVIVVDILYIIKSYISKLYQGNTIKINGSHIPSS